MSAIHSDEKMLNIRCIWCVNKEIANLPFYCFSFLFPVHETNRGKYLNGFLTTTYFNWKMVPRRPGDKRTWNATHWRKSNVTQFHLKNNIHLFEAAPEHLPRWVKWHQNQHVKNLNVISVVYLLKVWVKWFWWQNWWWGRMKIPTQNPIFAHTAAVSCLYFRTFAVFIRFSSGKKRQMAKW